MHRWEYLTIRVSIDKWSDSLGRNGTLPENGEVGALLNDLGEQGWELSGAFNDSSGSYALDRFRLLLKRSRA